MVRNNGNRYTNVGGFVASRFSAAILGFSVDFLAVLSSYDLLRVCKLSPVTPKVELYILL